jgi:UDP-N-acetylmuramoylalanine--D-glutamate ligase
MEMKGQKIAVIGGGESGVGAAILARKLGYWVFLSDSGGIRANYQKELEEMGIPFEENGHSPHILEEVDLVVKSPGISPSNQWIQHFHKSGIPVISEIEFGARHTQLPIIAITGTNGKSTTTKLTWHLLQTAGMRAELGGNIGTSFAGLVANATPDYFVLEVSSFQLEDCPTFKPKIAALLNITPDHLDRYNGSMEQYAKAKFQIFKNQNEGDVFLFHSDDEWIDRGLALVDSAVKKIGIAVPSVTSNNHLTIGSYSFRLRNSALLGQHNAHNASFAIAIALHINIDPSLIQKGLDTFEGLPHRMQTIKKINGVTYINDSKATNIDATYYALGALHTPIIWIAGGVDKGNDYSTLYPVMDQVKAIIGIGRENSKLWSAFEQYEIIKREAETMDEAVQLAATIGSKNDTVLLAPACASFDRFKNFEQRGELFEKAVNKL